MKNIFYICTKPITQWDVFIPSEARATISVLLLHQEQNIKKIPVSQIYSLDTSKQQAQDKDSSKSMTYQEMLEQVFIHDLAVVI